MKILFVAFAFFLATPVWEEPHFITTWEWDPVETADHYWICFSDDPRDFQVSLSETDALCAPIYNGARYILVDSFENNRYGFEGPGHYVSVLSCNEEAGCGSF